MTWKKLAFYDEIVVNPMAAALNMSGYRIINATYPQVGSDVVNKSYLDSHLVDNGSYLRVDGSNAMLSILQIKTGVDGDAINVYRTGEGDIMNYSGMLGLGSFGTTIFDIYNGSAQVNADIGFGIPKSIINLSIATSGSAGDVPNRSFMDYKITNTSTLLGASIASNSARITTNSANITSHGNLISSNSANITTTVSNLSSVDVILGTRIATNSGNITTHASLIASNSANITTLDTFVDSIAANTSTLWLNITSNAVNITTVSSNLANLTNAFIRTDGANYMKGNLNFSHNQATFLCLEALASNPSGAFDGRFYYNTADDHVYLNIS